MWNFSVVSFHQLLVAALCVSLVVAAPSKREADDEKPDPYSFAFEETDEFGTKLARQETGDANGVVQGSYSYIDAQGLTRTVNYIADDDGFRASIVSNEPGLKNSEPAGALYSVQ